MIPGDHRSCSQKEGIASPILYPQARRHTLLGVWDPLSATASGILSLTSRLEIKVVIFSARHRKRCVA